MEATDDTTDDTTVDRTDDTSADPTAASTVDAADATTDATPPRSRWARPVRLAVNAGAGLVIVQTVFILLAVIEGLSVRRRGTGAFNGDLLHRIGIVFANTVNIQSGLALLAGVALVSAPMLAPAGARTFRALRSGTLVATQVVAIVIAVGTILGVRASLYVAKLQGQKVTPSQRWELTAYLVGTLGTAVVAFLVALAAMPGDEEREPRS